MILANYAQQNRNAVREWGQAFTNPIGGFRPTMFSSFATPGSAQPGRDLSAFNHGYNTHSAWWPAMKTGGIASTGYILGEGTLSGSALAVKLASADLTGAGALEAIGSLIVQAVAALTGSGTVTDADVQAFLAAVANLTGSGGVSDADLEGLGALIAAIAGAGTAAGSTLTGVGALSADLVVTGTGLSTANVGQAVWATLIEAGFTAEQVLRIVAAQAAGAATGLENGSPVFKGIDGTTDRIVGTYSAGTRTVTDLNGD
jgi:hypothetical protein